MGFCRRCGDIVSGERCKCGGAAVAPVVSWKDHDAESNDKWSRTYVLRDRSASLSASQFKGNTKSASTSLPADLSARVSAHIVAVASVDPRAAVPLKPTVTGPAPEVGILPSPSDSTLSKVYGSVLQPKESLATFSCWACGDVFPPDATIYPDPRALDSASANRFLCRGCFMDNGGTKGTCPTCSRPVLTLKSEGGFVHSAGKYWHKRCFNCSECQKNIGDAPLVDLLGRPSCPECFDSCLRRPSERDQTSSTPTKFMRHSPITRRNIGGMETTSSTTTTQFGSNSREASPALEELEQRLGIVRNTREGSPSLEELSQKLSSIGKEPSRARRDSRHSERFRSPEPEDVFSSSPERASGLRYSTGTPSQVHRQTTESNGNSSPAPTPEAIEEMKLRFMKSATASSPSMSSPLNHLAQSFTTIFPSQLHTSSRTRSSSSLLAPIIPTPPELADEIEDQDVKGFIDENVSLVHSPMDLPTPDLVSDASDDTEPSSPSMELQLCGRGDAKLSNVNQHDEVHSDTESDSRETSELDTHEKRVRLGALPMATEETGNGLTTSIDIPSKKVDTNMTPPSKIPVARKSLGTKVINQAATPASMVMPASSSTARCTKCTGLLFTNGEGRYLTLPVEEGAKSKMYHVECFRCVVCEGTFEEGGNGQAIFVKAHGGPCHVECAPPERHVVRKSTSPKSNYVKSAVAASEKTTETRTSISRTAAPSTSKNMNPPHSSSRYEPPTLNPKPANISPNLGTSGNTRFGCRTVCPGCNISVSPMERGVVPGPQGTRWHATCLVCGGKKRKEAIAKQKSALWIVGRGGFDEGRNGKPGCGKKLDSAAKTDGDGGVWCRACLLLLGSTLVPSSTGTSSKGIAVQHSGTTIAKQFTGLSEFGKESGLLKQLTGGGLSPTRSISPTKQIGGSFWSGAGASGRPRPKSVIGTRISKSTDEGRGMYLVRQMTGNSPVARET